LPSVRSTFYKAQKELILMRIYCWEIELHKNKNKGKEKYQKIIVSFTMNEWPWHHLSHFFATNFPSSRNSKRSKQSTWRKGGSNLFLKQNFYWSAALLPSSWQHWPPPDPCSNCTR
jgi:hypothetical protein